MKKKNVEHRNEQALNYNKSASVPTNLPSAAPNSPQTPIQSQNSPYIIRGQISMQPTAPYSQPTPTNQQQYYQQPLSQQPLPQQSYNNPVPPMPKQGSYASLPNSVRKDVLTNNVVNSIFDNDMFSSQPKPSTPTPQNRSANGNFVPAPEPIPDHIFDLPKTLLPSPSPNLPPFHQAPSTTPYPLQPVTNIYPPSIPPRPNQPTQPNQPSQNTRDELFKLQAPRQLNQPIMQQPIQPVQQIPAQTPVQQRPQSVNQPAPVAPDRNIKTQSQYNLPQPPNVKPNLPVPQTQAPPPPVPQSPAPIAPQPVSQVHPPKATAVNPPVQSIPVSQPTTQIAPSQPTQWKTPQVPQTKTAPVVFPDPPFATEPLRPEPAPITPQHQPSQVIQPVSAAPAMPAALPEPTKIAEPVAQPIQKSTTEDILTDEVLSLPSPCLSSIFVPPREGGVQITQKTQKMQEKLCLRYINAYLSQRGISVSNLTSDLTNGVHFIILVECITQIPLAEDTAANCTISPTTKNQYYLNFYYALLHLYQLSKPLPEISISGMLFSFLSFSISF